MAWGSLHLLLSALQTKDGGLYMAEVRLRQHMTNFQDSNPRVFKRVGSRLACMLFRVRVLTDHSYTRLGAVKKKKEKKKKTTL